MSRPRVDGPSSSELHVDERRKGAHALAGQAECSAHAAIDDLRHAARHDPGERRQPRRIEHRPVHLLDNARHAIGRVKSEAAQSKDIRKRNGGEFC